MTTLTETPPAAPPELARTRPSLLRLTRIELRKMADTRAGMWLLIAVALITVAAVVLMLVYAPDEEISFGQLFALTLQPVAVILPILGILSVTSEWSQRTALSTFALVPSRIRVVAAKLMAASVLAVLAVLVALLAAAVGNLIAGEAWNLAIGNVLTGLLYLWLGILAGVALGLLLQVSALAIVLYFVLPTAWGILGEIVSWLKGPADWLDTGRTFLPLVDNTMVGDDWAKLATSVSVWVGLPLAIGFWRLLRREIN